MSKTRVLMIGAGHRAQATLFPAFHCMRPWVELVGVQARTVRNISLLKDRFSITTAKDLDHLDLSSVDAIIVAVGQRQVPDVLRSLQPQDTRGITLMLDTPVLHHRDLHAMRYFAGYKQVLAAEDCYALPPYALARRLVGQGVIGRLQHVYLLHSGYRFHALASLKQLTGASHPTSIRVKRWNPWCARVTLRFPTGVKATILEPRDYAIGRISIVGEKGFITDYAIEHEGVTRIDYRMEGGRYVGLLVDGEPVAQSDLDVAFVDGLAGVDLVDPSLMNMLKIRGFMDLLAALNDDDLPFRYRAVDAMHDNLSLRVAERTRFLKDFRLGGRTTLFGQAIKVTAGLESLRSHR